MKRLFDLREYILAQKLAEPDHLITAVTDPGRVEYYHGEDLSFRKEYVATLIFTEFSRDVDLLIVLLLSWLKENQPEVVGKKITFEADILNSKSVDLEIKIPMQETVGITTEAGRKVLHICPEQSVSTDYIDDTWTLVAPNGDEIVINDSNILGGKSRDLYINNELQEP